ncbi:hypothetical protein [Actinoplanes sp. TFC3]|uniref:hypothetical protein n=1 Tax=Actinoplanes sp. TFC3 TaxID=1710355 RepID=UPI00082C7624|nr:hypothetical protein [Actinoplanes sp. TFC3]
MLMTFDVGTGERHRVEFRFDKFWGGLSIKVDGVDVVSTVQFLSVDLVKRFEFVVGHEEQHRVLIEKHRQRLMAGFRPQPVYAYVDGELVAQAVA